MCGVLFSAECECRGEGKGNSMGMEVYSTSPAHICILVKLPEASKPDSVADLQA